MSNPLLPDIQTWQSCLYSLTYESGLLDSNRYAALHESFWEVILAEDADALRKTVSALSQLCPASHADGTLANRGE
jgi:hypothetical protein